MWQIIETETGVYQSSPLRRASIMHLFVLFGIVTLTLAGKIPLMPTLPFFIGFVAVSLLPLLFERWKYGSLGKPMIELQDGALVVFLPNDSRDHLLIPLANLQEIIVYGPEARHYYRFIRSDGTFIEAAPMWSQSIDKAATGFLQRQLSTVTKVTVKEPQLLFSYIRGEGP